MTKGELVLEDRLYTETHEWVKKVGENRYQVGITDYAQFKLKDIYIIELSTVGTELEQSQEGKKCEFGHIESMKHLGELFSPFKGKIVAINEKDNFGEIDPQQIEETSTYARYGGELTNISNQPYETWLIEIETDDQSQLGNLLLPQEYKKKIEKLLKEE